jgi:cytoplasmic iron level regulating protein YaaA (DUF328/UPF0246 family)
MQIITAPSKTQAFNGRAFADHTLPPGLAKTGRIIARLKGLNFSELGQLMKTSDKLTEATRKRIAQFSLPFSLTNARQALFTFQGDAYSAICSGSYSAAQLHHAQRHLVILSGLYGALRPLDLMQPYRLEMGCRLSVDGAPDLYHFWRDEVTSVMNEAFCNDKDKTLINLASAEYAKVIARKALRPKFITITFKQRHKKGGYRTIPIHSKRARGSMIHFMITGAIDMAEGLLEFNLDGYRFNRKESTEDEWIFLQEQ